MRCNEMLRVDVYRGKLIVSGQMQYLICITGLDHECVDSSLAMHAIGGGMLAGLETKCCDWRGRSVQMQARRRTTVRSIRLFGKHPASYIKSFRGIMR